MSECVGRVEEMRVGGRRWLWWWWREGLFNAERGDSVVIRRPDRMSLSLERERERERERVRRPDGMSLSLNVIHLRCGFAHT